MLRTVIVITAFALSASAALADVYTCRSLAGAAPVTLGFTLVATSGTFSVTDAAFEGGGIAFSTTATDPAGLATITDIDMDNKVRFLFHHADADVATVHLVNGLTDGGEALATGTLKVQGGGLWAMRCDIAHEG